MNRPNFTLITECTVLEIEKSGDGKTVMDAIFKDSNVEIGFQGGYFVCSSTYQPDNVRLLLQSKIGEAYNPSTGEGAVGRAYNYQTNRDHIFIL